mmetsp:Transcript_12471/g.50138  ORF Transcript_12471/g.50138 Transcript_12471/m.50138 type:complete len:317 (+) Transcript_12471:26-976(+)
MWTRQKHHSNAAKSRGAVVLTLPLVAGDDPTPRAGKGGLSSAWHGEEDPTHDAVRIASVPTYDEVGTTRRFKRKEVSVEIALTIDLGAPRVVAASSRRAPEAIHSTTGISDSQWRAVVGELNQGLERSTRRARFQLLVTLVCGAPALVVVIMFTPLVTYTWQRLVGRALSPYVGKTLAAIVSTLAPFASLVAGIVAANSAARRRGDDADFDGLVTLKQHGLRARYARWSQSVRVFTPGATRADHVSNPEVDITRRIVLVTVLAFVFLIVVQYSFVVGVLPEVLRAARHRVRHHGTARQHGVAWRNERDESSSSTPR